MSTKTITVMNTPTPIPYTEKSNYKEWKTKQGQLLLNYFHDSHEIYVTHIYTWLSMLKKCLT